MHPLTLFDYAAANEAARAVERVTAAAIQQVDDHADGAWRKAAFEAVRTLAETGQPFTTDDAQAGMPDDVTTHEPRAWGAIMRIMARQGVIEATSQYVNSEQVSCHGRPKRLWRGTNGSK